MEESTRAMLENAIDLMKAGKQEEAVPLLAGLMRKNPDLELGWFLLGMALEPAHQRIRAFKEVLRINPNNQKAKDQLDQLTRSAGSSEPLPHVSPFHSQPSPPKKATGANPATPPVRKAPPPQSASVPKTPAQSPSSPTHRTPENPTPAQRQAAQPQAQKMPTRSSTPPRQSTPTQAQMPSTRSAPPAKRMSTPYRKPRPAPSPPVVRHRKDTLERTWKWLLDMRMQFVGGTILLIGIALTVLLVSSLAKDVPLWIFGRTVDGTITAKVWSDFDYFNPDMQNKNLANQIALNMQYYFEYEFTTPDGETYVGKSEVTEEEFLGYGEGMHLKVRYSTLNPENSRLDDARFVPFLMCTYSIFIIITLFTLAAGREMVDF